MNNKISIDELNNAINECRLKTIGVEFIDYHFLEFASQEFMKIANFNEEPLYIKYYSHEQALAIVLDFFKSLGVEEWYDKAKEIIFSLNKNIGINIFNYEEASDLKATDKNGIKMFSMESGIESRIDENDDGIIKDEDPKSLVRISKNSRYYGINEIFKKYKITLEDIQTIVHEISHSFDISNDLESIEKRSIIAEITPFCFEKMLDEYLISNNIVNRTIVNSINTDRSQDIMYHARYVYTVINLYRIQEEDGRITKEGINEFLREKNIHDIDYVRECLMDVIDSDYHVKYLIAGLASSMYLKHFKENSKQALERLQKYCKYIKDGDVSEETLKLVGFEQDDKSVKEALNEFTDNFKGSR